LPFVIQGPSWDGKSGVHTHMTNTRITDPEIIEKRWGNVHFTRVRFTHPPLPSRYILLDAFLGILWYYDVSS
jgi:hypothetical protein